MKVPLQAKALGPHGPTPSASADGPHLCLASQVTGLPSPGVITTPLCERIA